MKDNERRDWYWIAMLIVCGIIIGGSVTGFVMAGAMHKQAEQRWEVGP